MPAMGEDIWSARSGSHGREAGRRRVLVQLGGRVCT